MAMTYSIKRVADGVHDPRFEVRTNGGREIMATFSTREAAERYIALHARGDES